jgi:hypothetical protein
MNFLAEGEIKDSPEAIKEWDEVFHNQVLMVKNKAGRNTLIPLLQECNIAIMEETTEEEIEEMKKMAKERAEEMEAQGGGKGGLISMPKYGFPGGNRS